jgi:DNA processing protein
VSGFGRLSLSDSQRIAWLRLIRTDNVGPGTFRDLINRFGSADAALEALPELGARGGGRVVRPASVAQVEAEIEAAERHGARFVAIGEADYPPMLARMDAPPPIVAIRGVAELGRLPAISIVGARNASLSGIRFARMLAGEFGTAGYAVVSGLARGIDTAAHAGSIDTGTIGVLAGGLDHPYPPENAELCNRIAEKGFVISEMPFGWQPRARDFPRRNRLVAALGIALVVVEAAVRSGSLISARLANETGRLVFAVPGSPLDPRSEGTNGLLRQGAMIATSAADVLEAVAGQTGRDEDPAGSFSEPPDFDAAPPPAQDDRARVVEALGTAPVPVDELIHHTGLHPAPIFMVLLELDLAGRLERHPGGAVSLLVGDS